MDFGSKSKSTRVRGTEEGAGAGMRYVSQYNYFNAIDRLARSGEEKPNLSDAIAGLSRFSLRDVLNNEEIVTLYQHRSTLEMVRRWGDCGTKIDREEIRDFLRKQERFFVRQYVLKVNTPRYHGNQKCEFLKASFENFETPPEIAALGDDKVSEFQEFCDLEWPKYKDKPVDVFWTHVGAHFNGLPISPKEISYASRDGSEEVRNIEDLEQEVRKAAEDFREYAKSNSLNGYVYAPPKNLYASAKDPALTGARRQLFSEFLKLKKAIKILVFNFHRIELDMPEGLLSGELLAALGFLPCKACCGSADVRVSAPLDIKWID